MCELFGVSSSAPVQVKYSLHAFAEHGGLIHPNKSGWGIAYHEGKDALLIKEPEPASDSPWVRFIETQPLTSTCIVAHVRYATAGAPAFAPSCAAAIRNANAGPEPKTPPASSVWARRANWRWPI